MADFYHDAARRLLIYRPENPDLVCQHIPESKRLNGAYVAFPSTLHNVQVARLLNLDVPNIMELDGYDWPIERGRKPLAHQKMMAAFMASHPRCFNLSDMGCVGGETLIDTIHGKIEIATLAAIAKPVAVRTLTNDGPRFVEIQAPFKKGRDDLHRVTFQSGRSIVVTKRHVFLTSHGWTSCEQLRIGESLPVFDVYPQQSNWEPCHVKFPQGAPHLPKIISDYSGCSEILAYDEPPLSAANIDLVSLPSLGGVLIRTRFAWHTDVQGSKHIHMDPYAGGLHSTRRCAVRIDQGEMGAFLSVCATKLSGNRFHICAQYRLFPNQLREAREGQELRLCIPLERATAPPFDTVTHIAYERTDVYYDMQVPGHENYVAHGLCNHNTMKTLSTLWAADYLMSQYPKGEFRGIIVAPLSILERVWGSAIFGNFLGRRTYQILHGSAARRVEQIKNGVDFYIINFDGVGVGAKTRGRWTLDGVSKELADRSDIKLVIVDEGSAYRDGQTRRSRLARQILAPRPYFWLLTGTPTPNGPTDAYGLAKLVNNAYGESYHSYHNRVMIRWAQWVWKPKPGANDAARRLLTPAIRVDIRDVWDGPPMTVQQREVPLTAEQTQHFQVLKREMAIELASGALINPANQAAARQKYMQISAGGVYDDAHSSHAVDAEPRIKELLSTIRATPRKIVVFVPLTNIIGMLYKRLNQEGIRAEIIDGGVPAGVRSDLLTSFGSDTGPRVLLCNPGTTALGINEMVAADTAVWYCPVDKTEHWLQGNARVHRPGQKWPVTIVQLVSNPLEREIFRRLEANETLQGLLLTMVKEGRI